MFPTNMQNCNFPLKTVHNSDNSPISLYKLNDLYWCLNNAVEKNNK